MLLKREFFFESFFRMLPPVYIDIMGFFSLAHY